MRTQRSVAAAAVTALLVGGVVVSTASAGTAASCVYTSWSSKASDYAVTSDANGACSVVRVGHYFNPAGTTSTIFTGTHTDPNWVRTGVARELSSSVHSGS